MPTRTARQHRFRGCRHDTASVGALTPAAARMPAADTGVARAAPDQQTDGRPPHLRTLLSEGIDFDPRTPGRLAQPRSLTATVGAYLWVLPPQTRGILEMLAVLNLRMPLAQLGQAAQVDSPSAAIEPAVASGLVDWSPEEPSCPVEIRHLLVRDAVYAGITPTRRRALHASAAAIVSESASWEHRVAALEHPDEDLAVQLEQLAGGEAAGGRFLAGQPFQLVSQALVGVVQGRHPVLP